MIDDDPPLTPSPTRIVRKGIVTVIRRPRQYSLDYSTSPTESRSYSVVRRLETRTSPILYNSNHWMPSPTIMESNGLPTRKVFVVRKRKVSSYESNEPDTSFEQPSRIKYVRRVRKYEEPWNDITDSDNVQKRSIIIRRENKKKRSNGLAGVTSKCTKLCLISSLIASLLTAAIVSAIIIPIMIKSNESSTQTTVELSTIATTDCPEGSGGGEPVMPGSLSIESLVLRVSSIMARNETTNVTNTTHNEILRNLFQNISHQHFTHNTLQLTLNFHSVTNNSILGIKTNSKNCTTQCDLSGNWTIPIGSEVIGYQLSFIENH